MPKKNPQTLFGPDLDWWYNACVNYMPEPLDAYAEGYRGAAELLVAYSMRHRHTLDTLVYPILFLYRHYLELRLKELIVSGGGLVGRRGAVPRDHRLDNLWGICRPILDEISPDEPPSTFTTIRRCVRDFARIDPDAQAFRYSRSRQGDRTLADIRHINLRNVQDRMRAVSRLLDGASAAIHEYRSFRP